MYKLGDKVFVAFLKSHEKWVTCPHCFGKRALTVILGDDSQVSIDCDCCRYGFEGSKGYLKSWGWVSGVKESTITKVEQEWPEKIEYGVDGGYRVDQDKVFDTQVAAEIRAQELIIEQDKKELHCIQVKERVDRNWAWNVRYHRERIKQSEKDLEYHRAKLAVAQTHVKEDKNGS